MRTRNHYIPIAEASSGMALAMPLNVVESGMLSMVLPAGHVLTEDNLNQLNAHHAEFIHIQTPDERSDEQIALDAAQAAHRVMDIFRGCDLSDPTLVALFDQVYAYRNT